MAENTPHGIAGESVESATDHIAGVMNQGWLCMLLSLGERLGLHDALATAGPASAAELAERTGCGARYIQEWAWGMVAGGILRHIDGPVPRFELPIDYVPALTSQGGPLHWSRITTQITALATLETPLVDAIRADRGLPVESYEGRIAEVFAGESGPIFERVLLHESLPATGMVDALESGITFADLGCGTGTAALIVARAFPRTRVIGVDQSPSALAIARERAEAQSLTNVDFIEGDLEDAVPVNDIDLIMAANVTHDLSDPQSFFTRVRAALTPGGLFYLHELSATNDMAVNAQDPHALGILAFSLYHCLPLARRRDGIAPGGMWGREHYFDALRKAGFAQVDLFHAPSDPNNDTILAR